MNVAHVPSARYGLRWPHGFGWLLSSIVLAIILFVGLSAFSRARHKGENYITLEAKAAAQTTSRDPCEILKEWFAAAKEDNDSETIRAIQQAQKFLDCRNIQMRSPGGVPMGWYAAHAIMLVKFKDERQDKFPFWENVILIEAQSHEEAFAKAEARAKQDEGDSRGTLSWEGRPACWSFAGIRKLMVVEGSDVQPNDGDEVTYMEMEIADGDQFAHFLNGEAVAVQYA